MYIPRGEKIEGRFTHSQRTLKYHTPEILGHCSNVHYLTNITYEFYALLLSVTCSAIHWNHLLYTQFLNYCISSKINCKLPYHQYCTIYSTNQHLVHNKILLSHKTLNASLYFNQLHLILSFTFMSKPSYVQRS